MYWLRDWIKFRVLKFFKFVISVFDIKDKTQFKFCFLTFVKFRVQVKFYNRLQFLYYVFDKFGTALNFIFFEKSVFAITDKIRLFYLQTSSTYMSRRKHFGTDWNFGTKYNFGIEKKLRHDFVHIFSPKIYIKNFSMSL